MDFKKTQNDFFVLMFDENCARKNVADNYLYEYNIIEI